MPKKKNTTNKKRMVFTTTLFLVTGHTQEWAMNELTKNVKFKVETRNPLRLMYLTKNMYTNIYVKIVPCVLKSKSIHDIPECRSIKGEYICREIPELLSKIESMVKSYDKQAENYIKCFESDGSNVE